MKIQVIGSHGMLGWAVCEAVQRAGHTTHSNGVEITTVWDKQLTGEVVINCAGIVKQRTGLPASEFMRVNAYGPHRLAEACDVARVRLIHVSTDCVFNNGRIGEHNEYDTPTPNDIYSMSKLAGEVTHWPHLTIRSSFVGQGKRGLLAELQGKRGQVIETGVNMLWSGHTVNTLADVLVTLAEREHNGLLHIPGESQTRGELIRRLSQRFDLGITVNETDTITSGYDRRLSSVYWSALDLPPLPTFAEQLKAL